MAAPSFESSPRIADELKLPLAGVRAAVRLLTDGASVPFVARYRKEQTGGLDEVQLRSIEEKNAYCIELDGRRRTILNEVESQGKLTPELRAQIESTWSKTALEDLYLPFKPRRRTRAAIARERGLEPLAGRILAQPLSGAPGAEAGRFVDAGKGVPDAAAALAGARDIVAEAVAERRDARAYLRGVFESEGILACTPVKSKTKERTKFETYYEFRERVGRIPSHRFLAIHRGEAERVLRVSITIDEDRATGRLEQIVTLNPRSPFAGELRSALGDAIPRLLVPSLETEVRNGLVHVSQLAERFVKDPHEVARVGDTMKVRVLEIDLERRRIALSARPG